MFRPRSLSVRFAWRTCRRLYPQPSTSRWYRGHTLQSTSVRCLSGNSGEHETATENRPTPGDVDDTVETLSNADNEEFYSLGPLRMRKVNANIPNFLTFVRIGMSLPVGYLFYTGEYKLAFAGFFVAGACDFFDGYLARRWNQKTVRGLCMCIDCAWTARTAVLVSTRLVYTIGVYTISQSR